MDITNLVGSVPLNRFTEEQLRKTILSWVAENLKFRLKDYNMTGHPTGYSRRLWAEGRGVPDSKTYMPNRVKENIELLEDEMDIIAYGIIESSLIVMENLLVAAREAKTQSVRKKYINSLGSKEFLISTLQLAIFLYAKTALEKGYDIEHEYLTIKINGVEINKAKISDIWKRQINGEYSLEEAAELTNGLLENYQSSLTLTKEQLEALTMEKLLLNLIKRDELDKYITALAEGVSSKLTGKFRIFYTDSEMQLI